MTIRTAMRATKREAQKMKNGNLTRTTISIDSDLYAFGKHLAVPLRGNFSLAIEQLLRRAQKELSA